jgi:uncharacterized protein
MSSNNLSFIAQGAVGAIKAYQVLSKPVYSALSYFGVGKICRFEPSCSEYTRQAIEKYGFVHGGAKGLVRILKCNPLNHSDHIDPLE